MDSQVSANNIFVVPITLVIGRITFCRGAHEILHGANLQSGFEIVYKCYGEILGLRIAPFNINLDY